VGEDVRSWGLPRAVHAQVYSRLLHDLASNPDELLGDRIVPLAAFAYEFTLVDEGAIPYRLHFLFAVERDDAAQELRVVGCRLTREDRGEN
jgi:hypothetical protein